MTIPTDVAQRDRWILEAVRAGRHDPIRWCEVPISIPGHVGMLYVSADYLAIDGVRMPASATTSQLIADEFDAILPTVRISDLTWIAAAAKLEPRPHGPPYDSSMLSVERLLWSNDQIEAQLQGRHGELVAGHKKDVVISARLLEKPSARGPLIFGWHQRNGHAIQPLSAAHRLDAGYADYSHGVRLVRRSMLVDGVATDIRDVLASPDLVGLVSAEPAPVPWRYPHVAEGECDDTPDTDPAPAAPAPPTPRQPGGHAMSEHRTIRRGDKGEDVKAWQRAMGVVADGDFGSGTEKTTRMWQLAHGLVGDGIVGARSWATIGSVSPLADSTPAPTTPPAPIKFVQARNYHRGRIARIGLVVLHSMEAAEASTTAENVAAWFAGHAAPMASAHYNIDADSVVQSVREEDTAFHAPGANANGIGIEHAGYARQTAAEWSDAYSTALLERSARLVADICARRSIPIAYVDAAGLLRGLSGITTHADVSKAFKKSTHTDPGASFPMAAYLERVRLALR